MFQQVSAHGAQQAPYLSAVAGDPKAAGRAVAEAVAAGAHIAAVVHALVLTPVRARARLRAVAALQEPEQIAADVVSKPVVLGFGLKGPHRQCLCACATDTSVDQVLDHPIGSPIAGVLGRDTPASRSSIRKMAL
jgi:hypothetical protein